MDFRSFGKYGSPTLLLIPGLGVSYEIFLPLIGLLEDRFHIIAAEVDGFTHGLSLGGGSCLRFLRGMNHGQFLIDNPVQVAERIIKMQYE